MEIIPEAGGKNLFEIPFLNERFELSDSLLESSIAFVFFFFFSIWKVRAEFMSEGWHENDVVCKLK